MRVSSVSYFNNKYFQNSLGAQAVVDNDKVTPVPTKDKNSANTTKFLLYGIGALAVLGIGYKLLKGKGPSVGEKSANKMDNIIQNELSHPYSNATISKFYSKNKVNYGKVVKETKDSVIELETKPFRYLHDEPENTSYEKLITITNKNNGITRTYQNFYRNGKLYETNLSVDIPKNGSHSIIDSRVNYAYDDKGNLEFIARQILGRTDNKGSYHNFDINNKTKPFEPFPIIVKSVKEDKAKVVSGVYTFEDLCEYNSAFDPLK